MPDKKLWEIEDYPAPEYLDGMVQVDDYYLPAAAAEEYRAERERYAAMAAEVFREFCPSVSRQPVADGDGEAMLGRDADGSLRMLVHLDPESVEQMKLAELDGCFRQWLLDYNQMEEPAPAYEVRPEIREAVRTLTALPRVQRALQYIRDDHENSIRQQLELVQIPAPTFSEQKRAAYMAEQFRVLGLSDVHIDRTGNVVGVRPGCGTGPCVVLDGHMDTVYPPDTPLIPHRDEEFIYCPGIVDDTRACAAMLSLIRALNEADIRTGGDLIFLATVREEGMGGFGGMKGFLADHPGVGACVCMDGYGAQGIVYQATGFKTIEVTFRGIGGHAYGAFGEVANPLHAAARAVAKIAELRVPAEPKTTYCVSNFHSGSDVAVHAITSEAVIKINYRSNGQQELEALDREIFRCLREACAEETARWGRDAITCSVRTLCDVPAGSLDPHAPIVETAWEVIRFLGKEPRLLEGGPTNASIPIGLGIPAICIGDGDLETFCHNAALERFPVKDSWEMPQLGILAALAAAGVDGEISSIL